MSVRSYLILAFALVSFAAIPAVHAQWAVIDVASVTRLTTEIQTLDQALTTAREHLAEARTQLRSMTGDRGMERLLTNIPRNYLPVNWAQLSAAAAGDSSAYGALGEAVKNAISEDSVLMPGQLARLAPDARAQIALDRRTGALLQAISREALANTSGRFGSLQQLITAIGTAGDQKGILDLTARIAAEEVMLENEQTKLRELFATAKAERWAARERERERSVIAAGDFAKRFHPKP